MKKLIESFTAPFRAPLRLLLLLVLAFLAFSLQPAAFAQPGTAGTVYQVLPPAPVFYPLTNGPASWRTNTSLVSTNVIAVTNGYTMLSSNCTYIVESQPFKIWPGRGFALSASFKCTNAENSVLTFNLKFATIHPAPWGGSTLVTNWTTTPAMAIGCAATGTTTVYFSTNITSTVVDNYQLGEVYSIGVSTAATATLLDPTNTFVDTFPATVTRAP
jgi:hypothetical protein